MGLAGAILGGMSTGHGNQPPVPILEGSSDVFYNGTGAARVGDALAPHPSETPHDSTIASGSSSVYVNGQAAARMADDTTCGDALAAGASNVFIG